MQVDFSAVLKDLDDVPIPVSQTDNTPTTLGFVCVNILLGMREGEKLSGKDKADRYELAMRVHKAVLLEVSIEDVALMKKLIGMIYPPLLMGQAWKFLENGVQDVRCNV